MSIARHSDLATLREREAANALRKPMQCNTRILSHEYRRADGTLSDQCPSSLLGRHFEDRGKAVCSLKLLSETMAEGWTAKTVIDACLTEAMELFDIATTKGLPEIVCFSCRLAVAALLPVFERYDALRCNQQHCTLDDLLPYHNIDDHILTTSAWSLPSMRRVLLSLDLWTTHEAPTQFGVVAESECDSVAFDELESMFARVFVKVLPKRYNFKNLRKAVVDVCSKDSEARDAIIRIIVCSVSGLYPNNPDRPNFEVMRCVRDTYSSSTLFQKNNTTRAAAAFVCRFEAILYFAIRQYLFYCLSSIPSVATFLMFSHETPLISSAVDIHFRKFSSAKIWKSTLFFDKVEDHFLTMPRPDIAIPFAIRDATVTSWLRDLMKSNLEFPEDNTDILYNKFTLSTCDDIMRREYGIPQSFSSVITRGLSTFVQTGAVSNELEYALGLDFMNVDVAKAISRYARDCIVSDAFSFIPLSCDIYKQQARALASRYIIVYDESTTKEELARLATYPFCLTCSTWKAPLRSKRRKKIKKEKKDNPLFSRGTQNIYKNCVSDKLECRACISNGILINLCVLGCAIRIANSMFTLCVSCGTVHSFSQKTLCRGGPLHCEMCIRERSNDLLKRSDRSNTCAYVHCSNYMCSGKETSLFALEDDIGPNATSEVCFFSFCGEHKRIGIESVARSRKRSVVSSIIEERMILKHKQKKQSLERMNAFNTINRKGIRKPKNLFAKFHEGNRKERRDKGGNRKDTSAT